MGWHAGVEEGEGEEYTGPAAGCTAVVAVIHGSKLYVANAGDSRCVLCRGKETVSLTEDHKPTNPDEERRIKAAGGFVTEGRINGGLNLSRAIGDMNYKTVCPTLQDPIQASCAVVLPFYTSPSGRPWLKRFNAASTLQMTMRIAALRAKTEPGQT